MQTNTKRMIRYISVTAILTALSYGLMLLSFKVPFMPSYISFDFSDLPALIASFAMGPLYGAAVCLIKNLLHLVISHSMFVGELSNFMLGCALVVPAGLIYQFNKTRKGALIAAAVGTLSMAVLSFPLNAFITYPVYLSVFFKGNMDALLSTYQVLFKGVAEIDNLYVFLLIFNAPFTFVKGLADSIITFVVYKRISPIIKGVAVPKRKKKMAVAEGEATEGAQATESAQATEENDSTKSI